jgi:hypothetical protein
MPDSKQIVEFQRPAVPVVALLAAPSSENLPSVAQPASEECIRTAPLQCNP